jgi:hypothetical protein
MNPAETAPQTRPTSELVIESVAEQADVDPLEFDAPLGEVVDPDALDSLFDPGFGEPRREGRVEFVYGEYRVTVVSDADAVSVDVEPLEDVADADASVGRQEA